MMNAGMNPQMQAMIDMMIKMNPALAANPAMAQQLIQQQLSGGMPPQAAAPPAPCGGGFPGPGGGLPGGGPPGGCGGCPGSGNPGMRPSMMGSAPPPMGSGFPPMPGSANGCGMGGGGGFPPTPAMSDPAPGLPMKQPDSSGGGAPPGGDGGGGPKLDKAEEIKVTDPQGNPVPLQPLETFAQCPFPQVLQQQLSQAGFTRPSPIQAYAWPIALQGNDVVGIAATGSGKTIAFLFPAFMYILDNRISDRSPTLLVLAPTRELAVQIEKEAQRFGTCANIKTVCAYGGAPKGNQLSAMRNGIHCLIATPGRLNDFLEGRQVQLGSVAKLVLDEADRMLDMGFEPQIRKILKEVPSRRHTLFFSATWPKEVRKLAEDFLYKPYQVEIGDRSELKANEDITQIVKIVGQWDKDQALNQVLNEHRVAQNNAKTIVFSATKRQCDTLERNLRRANFQASAIHGDKDQRQRDEALDGFRGGSVTVLVATDVAARGLDIKGCVLVINYDPANNTEDYVHRIGRTGRAGMKGTAVTFLSNDQAFKAKGIMEVMQKTNQQIPEELAKLASQASEKGGKGRRAWRDPEEKGGGKGGNREDRDRDGGGYGGGGSWGDRGGGGGGGGSWGGDRGGRGGGDGGGKSNPFDREENKMSASPGRKRSRSRRRRSPSRKRSRSGRGRKDRSKSRKRSRSRRKRSKSRDRKDKSRSRRKRSRSKSRRRRRSPSVKRGGQDSITIDDVQAIPGAADGGPDQSEL